MPVATAPALPEVKDCPRCNPKSPSSHCPQCLGFGWLARRTSLEHGYSFTYYTYPGGNR